uniref:Uncharacterized protein n=1 Tax=viral metagenome TaxID=1070528 RepID=A0A6M3IH13_9ZZZZ
MKKLLISLSICGLLAAPVFAADYEFATQPDDKGKVAADDVVVKKLDMRPVYEGSVAQSKQRIAQWQSEIDSLEAAINRELEVLAEMKAELQKAIDIGTVAVDKSISK